MSKQQGYQQLSTDAPDGIDYGFTARLPQTGGSYQTDKASSSTGAAGVSHPAPAYAGAPVTGYPVMTPSMAGGMAGPVGMGVEDPLGQRDRKRTRRQPKRMAGGAQEGDRRRRRLVRMLVVGPVGLIGVPVRSLVKLVRRAVHSAKEPPKPAHHPGSSNQEPASHPKS